jgi:hypothetical protein
MADTRTNKTKDEWISWKNRPYCASRSDENQRRAELWESFNAYCREHRGWITSPPGSRVAVLETERGSALPAKLAGLGYEVMELANGERLTGGGPSLAEEKMMRQGYEVSTAGPTMAVLALRNRPAVGRATAAADEEPPKPKLCPSTALAPSLQHKPRAPITLPPTNLPDIDIELEAREAAARVAEALVIAAFGRELTIPARAV